MAEIPGVDADEYIIRAVAVDFYGNKATFEKAIGETQSTSKTSSPTESKSTCGPAALLAFSLIPLALLRRKK